MKALDLLADRKIDHTFYPVVYGLTDEDDWHNEANWYKANPHWDRPSRSSVSGMRFRRHWIIPQKRMCSSSFV